MSEDKIDTQRLWDLVRQQRSELHGDGLISDEEYAALASDGGAVARLETYDEMRADLHALRAALAEAQASLAAANARWEEMRGALAYIVVARHESCDALKAHDPVAGDAAMYRFEAALRRARALKEPR
jgi:hypothetical protein